MSSISSHSSLKINRFIFDFQRPQTELQLISRVGDSGKYQRLLLSVFALSWFLLGALLLSPPLLLSQPRFYCPHQGLLLQETACLRFICTLSPDGREPYQQLESQEEMDQQWETMTGLYHLECLSPVLKLGIRGLPHLGAILGSLLASYLADNHGRKTALVASQTVCTLGSLLVVFGGNVWMAAAGLLLSGLGALPAATLAFLFFCEVVNDPLRQRYSVMMQACFPVGGLAAAALLLLFSNWRVTWALVVVLPCLLELVLVGCYVEETPHFLLKQGCESALAALNRIGVRNQGRGESLEEEEVESVIDFQQVRQLRDTRISHLDLFRFSSLRRKTVIAGLLGVVLFGMYFGVPLDRTDLGLDAAGFVGLGAELAVVLIVYLFVERIKRRTVGLALFAVAVGSLLLSGLAGTGVAGSSLQIVLLVLFRTATAALLAFFPLHLAETFPSRVRGLAFGLVFSLGSLSAALLPVLLQLSFSAGVNGAWALCGLGTAGAWALSWWEESRGKGLPQEIEEVAVYKRGLAGEGRETKVRRWASEEGKKGSGLSRMVQSGLP